TECLKDTVERVLPFWNESIAPAIRSGRRVLISAHGNSLRALIKHLDNVSDDDIVHLNIPTGQPLVYELDEQLRPIRHYYLGDPAEIEAAMAAVAAQGKAKQGCPTCGMRRDSYLLCCAGRGCCMPRKASSAASHR